MIDLILFIKYTRKRNETRFIAGQKKAYNKHQNKVKQAYNINANDII